LQSLFDLYAFIQRCDRYESSAIEILLTKPGRERAQDRGEVEAAAQAAEIGAAVLVDDSWGRELAALLGLETQGTWWVLQQFYKLQLLTDIQLRDCLASLRLPGIRLPWETIDVYLQNLGVPGL